MADIPHVQWNVRAPAGVAPTRMVVPLLAAPHHGMAVATLPGQRDWMAGRLRDLAGNDGGMLTIASIARPKARGHG